jgi:hypothetical protein
MAALLYLLAIFVVGDTLVRPILGAGRPRLPAPDRARHLASAFLAGFLALTWFTYVVAYLLREREDAMDLAGMASLGAAGLWLIARLAWTAGRGGWRGVRDPGGWLARPDPSELRDWVVILAAAVFAGWMMSRAYYLAGGTLFIGSMVWSDFGPTSAIAQSFALGHNFPTEYPHFPGFPILYHFLYYFAVGNLTRLGFDPALANNALSTLTMVSMLILVMSFGRVLFRSPAVGRLAVGLFFVHGSMSWLAYLASFSTVEAALADIWAKGSPLVSGFPYRGEEWGIWTQGTFLNQRHLAGAMGIALLAALFVVERYLARPDPPTAAAPRDASDSLARRARRVAADVLREPLPGYALVGLLLGLLPMWNSAVFVAAGAVFAVLFFVLPNRLPMIVVAVVAAAAAVPQLLALRPAGVSELAAAPAIHWGYTLEDPTLPAVAEYLGFTFGLKLLLSVAAIARATRLQGAVFLAFGALVLVAFGLQFSPEVFANHKFLNLWLIMLNLFAAAGFVTLWTEGGSWLSGRAAAVGRAAARALAAGLVAAIVIGGIIDLMPIKNTGAARTGLQGDRLFDWLLTETQPDDIFLTDLYVTHPILLAGRRVYYGWPYYAWSAGYPVGPREVRYRAMLGGTDGAQVVQLLQAEAIDYVAVDDDLRARDLGVQLNEPLFAQYLAQVFADPDGRYGHLNIYRVPAAGTAGPRS